MVYFGIHVLNLSVKIWGYCVLIGFHRPSFRSYENICQSGNSNVALIGSQNERMPWDCSLTFHFDLRLIIETAIKKSFFAASASLDHLTNQLSSTLALFCYRWTTRLDYPPGRFSRQNTRRSQRKPVIVNTLITKTHLGTLFSATKPDSSTPKYVMPFFSKWN